MLQYICLSLYIFKNLFLTKVKYFQVPRTVCSRHSQNNKSEFKHKTWNEFVVYKWMYFRALNLQDFEFEQQKNSIYIIFLVFDYNIYHKETWQKKYNCTKNLRKCVSFNWQNNGWNCSVAFFLFVHVRTQCIQTDSSYRAWS